MDKQIQKKHTYDTAVFAGGCFWCLEAVFRRLTGVTEVVSGYAGGEANDPTYEQVSSGQTGHAEAVKVEFDPEKISYGDLLTVFFSMHDPTMLNRQGADVGTQYRSAIFFTSEEQRTMAESTIAQLTRDEVFEKPIVTEVKQLGEFFPAEEYHKDYYEIHPEAAYCQAVISPKISKLRRSFSHLLKQS